MQAFLNLLQVLFLILAAFLILATGVFLFYCLVANFLGAPYLPSNRKRTKIIIEFAAIKKGEKAVDLGSGDGRLVVALAKKGAIAHGIEVNPILVLVSWLLIYISGLRKKAWIHYQSFWNANLASYNLVIVYGLPFFMSRLEVKLKKELKPGSKIISNAFKFKGLKQVKEKDGVYLYQI